MDICVVCRNKAQEFRPFWPGLKECCHCGHIMADLNIQDIELKNLYSNKYFAGEEYCDYLHDRKVFDKQFKSRLRDIIKLKSGGKLIEIGCAYGFFLSLAQKQFHVIGYDISEEPVRYARDELGLDARCEDFLDAQIESLSIDVVVMWDVIEHLSRPDLFVDKISEVLKPGGLLFMTTGDIGSFIPRIRKEKWRLIHPPTHIHYFNQDTIAKMLDNAGLGIEKLRHVGPHRSIRQIAFSLLALGKTKQSNIYNIISNSPIGDISFALNTYDIMLVVAKKL